MPQRPKCWQQERNITRCFLNASTEPKRGNGFTLLGLNAGDNATTGHGYLDIVDFIIQNCTNVEENLQELYRRVAFNICIGNSDDHFRNHGFLLTAKGWTLSPAYDMNPTLNEYQSLSHQPPIRQNWVFCWMLAKTIC